MTLLHPSFRWFGETGTVNAAEIDERARLLRASTASGAVVRLRSGSVPELAAALVGLEGHAKRVELVPESVDDDAEIDDAGWTLFTSGSSGHPRPMTHSLESLTRSANPTDGPRTWGLIYDPYRLAGLSVVLQAMATGSVLVDARHGGIGERVARMRDFGVDALSATPTLWRQILQSRESDGWPLRRVTLGGEVSDQRTLDALANAFPDARVTHIFASSETGVAFSVTDARAGFPASYLESPPRGVALQVRDGVLYVHNPASSAAGADGFASTEDAVVVAGDRVLFAGRVSGAVNVGGSKVFPEQVEAHLRDHESVADVVVRSRPNPFSGNILVALVQPRAGIPTDTLGADLRRWAADRLPGPMVPALVSIVAELPRAATGKAVRS